MASQSGSPGLVIPSAYDRPGGVPPNFYGVIPAQSAGIIPSNFQPANVIVGKAPRALLECQSSAGAQGTKFNGTNGDFTGNNSASGAMSDPGSGSGINSVLMGPIGVVVPANPTFQG